MAPTSSKLYTTCRSEKLSALRLPAEREERADLIKDAFCRGLRITYPSPLPVSFAEFVKSGSTDVCVEAGDMFHVRGIEDVAEVATIIGLEMAPSIISPELT